MSTSEERAADAAWHGECQHALLVRNAGRERNREELMTAMRHGVAGWALTQATDEELLKFVEVFRKSGLN